MEPEQTWLKHVAVGSPPPPENANSNPQTANLGHAKFGMGASIGEPFTGNRHPLITILQATPVINSSGFWTFDGLLRPRGSLSGSTGTYTSQLLSPQPQ